MSLRHAPVIELSLHLIMVDVGGIHHLYSIWGEMISSATVPNIHLNLHIQIDLIFQVQVMLRSFPFENPYLLKASLAPSLMGEACAQP